jgi:hypothetical protein
MCPEFLKSQNTGHLKFLNNLISQSKHKNPIIMKHLFFKTTILLFALTLSNCENNDPQDQLPPITQTGANTFGAIVDGRGFVPADSPSGIPGSSNFKGLQSFVGNDFINSSGNDKWTILVGNFEINPSIYLFIYIPSLLNINVNQTIGKSDGFENSDLQKPHIYCHINGNNNTYLSYENSGLLEFSRIDINKGIYSGIFTVTLKNKNNENDIIEITNGRFDIDLNTVNN